MKILLGVLCVVLTTHYVTSQVSLVESGPSIVKPTQSLDVTCTVKGASLTDSSKIYSVEWVRQFPGKGLDWMGRIVYNGDLYYAQSLKGRITITRDTSKGEVYFKLNNVNVDDSGRYHCAGYASGGYFDIWGQGTKVTVTSDSESAPSVFPIFPCCKPLSSTEVTIGCLSTGYLPPPVDVTWNSGSITTGIKNFPDTLSNNGKYISSSLLTIPVSEWLSEKYTCNVNHMGSKVDKIIPGTPPPPPSPTVHILQGSCFENTDDQVELTCQGYNLTSKDAKIRWFINEKERLLFQDLLYLEYSSLYSLHSTVSISLAEWNNGIRVKCQVTDTKTSKSSEATARKCSDISNCLGIEVIMVPPTIENLYVQKYAPIACTAYNLKQPTGSAFSFSYPGAPATVNSQTEDPQLNRNGTFSKTSLFTVTSEAWNSNIEFTCIFSIPGLEAPIVRTISKKTEAKLISPKIAVFPPTQEDIEKDELCIVTCISYDFYPANIYMGWVDEENVGISKDQHVNSEPKRNDRNQSYSASSLLSIPCSEWKEGKRYGCVVGHEAIPQKLSMKDIDKQSGNPSIVNVSLVLSDTNMVCH